jgi:hypothetical protein
MIGLELGGRSRLGILSMMKADEKPLSQLPENLKERSLSILRIVRSDLQRLDVWSYIVAGVLLSPTWLTS